MRHPRKHPEDFSAVAAAWLARRDAGWSTIEAAEFSRWRAENPRHESAAARLEATWTLLQQLGAYRPGARAHPDRDLLAPPQHRPRWFRALTGLAAAAALAVAVWWAFPGFKGQAVPAEAAPVFATTRGGYQRLTLADGSVVELNSDSEVRVRYSPEARDVALVRGQAHFTVAKNPDRPFRVATDAVTVRAVGTAFDVRLGATEVQVLVSAGTVELLRAREVNTLPLLPAGWRALVPVAPAARPVLEPVSAAGMREALAWHGWRLTFIETPLAEVVAQFNRRNEVQLELGDAELATMPVGGSFGAENLEAFVRLLSSNGDIRVERPVPGRIVLRKAR